MGVRIFATSLWAIWRHPITPKVCTLSACMWSSMYNRKTFGTRLSICSQVALDPGLVCPVSVRQIIALLARFCSAQGLFHSSASPKEVWGRSQAAGGFGEKVLVSSNTRSKDSKHI